MRYLLRALDVLELFWNRADEMSLAQIAELAKVSKTSANRITQTLVKRGYLKQLNRRGKYSLGSIFLEFSGIVKTKSHIRNVALPYLNKLSLALRESVNLTIWDEKNAALAVGEQFRVIHHTEDEPEGISSRDVPPEGVPEEGVLPLHCTAAGKIILASMSEEEFRKYYNGKQLDRLTTNTITDFDVLRDQLKVVKETGVAYDHEELLPGVVGVAAGLKNHEGRTVGAISVVGHPSRITHATLESMAPSVKACAAKISRKLGHISLSPHRPTSF